MGDYPSSGRKLSSVVSFSSCKDLPGNTDGILACDSPSILPCEAVHVIFDIRTEPCSLQGLLTACEVVPVDLCDFCSKPWSLRIASHDIFYAGLSRSVSYIQAPVRAAPVALELF